MERIRTHTYACICINHFHGEHETDASLSLHSIDLLLNEKKLLRRGFGCGDVQIKRRNALGRAQHTCCGGMSSITFYYIPEHHHPFKVSLYNRTVHQQKLGNEHFNSVMS